MKTLIASVVTFFVVLGGGAVYATPPETPGGIGVTGQTRWPSEFYEALGILNDNGIPIHDGCTGADLCVSLDHYSRNDFVAGYSSHSGTSGEVRINDRYDNKDRWKRLHVLIHEFGHIAGLGHTTSCTSSMYEAIPACGYYILGFTGAEQAEIRRLWG